MGAPVPIRDDIPAEELRRRARQESNGRVACRLFALANVLDGMSREQAARQAGMDSRTTKNHPLPCPDPPCSARPPRRVDDAGRRHLHEAIDDFRHGLVPLAVPITLIRPFARSCGLDYLTSQTFLVPYPKELALRSHTHAE